MQQLISVVGRFQEYFDFYLLVNSASLDNFLVSLKKYSFAEKNIFSARDLLWQGLSVAEMLLTP